MVERTNVSRDLQSTQLLAKIKLANKGLTQVRTVGALTPAICDMLLPLLLCFYINLTLHGIALKFGKIILYPKR
jgi:hypothetical protein